MRLSFPKVRPHLVAAAVDAEVEQGEAEVQVLPRRAQGLPRCRRRQMVRLRLLLEASVAVVLVVEVLQFQRNRQPTSRNIAAW